MDAKKLAKILVEACENDDAANENIDLLESGLLDSYALISLISMLEDEGITIYPSKAKVSIFKNINTLLKYINENGKK